MPRLARAAAEQQHHRGEETVWRKRDMTFTEFDFIDKRKSWKYRKFWTSLSTLEKSEATLEKSWSIQASYQLCSHTRLNLKIRSFINFHFIYRQNRQEESK